MSQSIISISYRSHLDVWILTSRMLVENVVADNYVLYVPKSDLKEFFRVSPGDFNIREQEELAGPLLQKLRNQTSAVGNSLRFGWYFQQFLKYRALEEEPADRLVIWDSDCVPVRKIELFNSDKDPLFMVAHEFNAEYFACIKRLLGLEKHYPFSFVIPGFPITRKLFLGFLEAIEVSNPGSSWSDSIMSVIDFAHPSGFSETETLGTWLSHQPEVQIRNSEYKWERRGQSRFGYSSNMNPKKLAKLARKHDLDLITFENWDLRGLKKLRSDVHRKLGQLFSAQIFD